MSVCEYCHVIKGRRPNVQQEAQGRPSPVPGALSCRGDADANAAATRIVRVPRALNARRLIPGRDRQRSDQDGRERYRQ